MRRFLSVLLLSTLLACNHDSTLAPVQTIDGEWSGIQNGYSLSLLMSHDGTTVSGYASMAGVGGFVEGSVTGTFTYPDVHLKLNFPNIEQVNYDGTMSATEAKIFAKLSGSGFNNLELDVKKKK